MKTRLLIPAAALVLSACGSVPDLGDVNFDGTVEDRAKLIAAVVDPMLPMAQGEFEVVEIRAEQKQLRLIMNGDLNGVSSDVSPFALTKILRPIICEEGYRGFIEAGGVVNFDIRDPNTGKTLPQGRVANCSGV